MLSHDFALALLAKRNHDLRFVTEVCFPGHDDEDGEINTTRLGDDHAREVHGMAEDVEVLAYSSEADMLDVQLGPIYAGKEGSFTLNPEEAQVVLRILERSSEESVRELRKRLRSAIE